MKEGNIGKRVTSTTKLMNLVESSSYIKYITVTSNNCRKIHTLILRKYYVTKFCVKIIVNTYEGLSFQKRFKAGSCN